MCQNSRCREILNALRQELLRGHVSSKLLSEYVACAYSYVPVKTTLK